MNKENGMGGSVMSTDNQSAQSAGESFETWYAANRQTLGATTSIAAMTVWYAALASGSKLTCFYAEEIGLPPHACLDCCYDPDEIRARSALAQAPAPSDVYPCVKLTVSEDGSVAASLYAPGLPAGVFNVFPLGIEDVSTGAPAPSGEALTDSRIIEIELSLREYCDADRYDLSLNAFARAIEREVRATHPTERTEPKAEPRRTGFAPRRDHYNVPVLFNPYTGEPRDVRDVQSDPRGILIVPPGADLIAAAPKGASK